MDKLNRDDIKNTINYIINVDTNTLKALVLDLKSNNGNNLKIEQIKNIYSIDSTEYVLSMQRLVAYLNDDAYVKINSLRERALKELTSNTSTATESSQDGGKKRRRRKGKSKSKSKKFKKSKSKSKSRSKKNKKFKKSKSESKSESKSRSKSRSKKNKKFKKVKNKAKQLLSSSMEEIHNAKDNMRESLNEKIREQKESLHIEDEEGIERSNERSNKRSNKRSNRRSSRVPIVETQHRPLTHNSSYINQQEAISYPSKIDAYSIYENPQFDKINIMRKHIVHHDRDGIIDEPFDIYEKAHQKGGKKNINNTKNLDTVTIDTLEEVKKEIKKPNFEKKIKISNIFISNDEAIFRKILLNE